MLYEIKCFGLNEPPHIVRLRAASLEEAMSRADKLWFIQTRKPQLLAVLDNPQQALAFL